MPANVVRTKEEERLWDKAKDLALENGHKEDYAYIMGIFKKMNPDRFKTASQIGQTILQQMGGWRKLVMFVGAKDALLLPQGVQFRWASREPARGGNMMRIVLDPDDTYTVTLIYYRSYTEKVLKTFTGIYADQLVSLFERNTGMYLSFGRTAASRSAALRLPTRDQLRTEVDYYGEIFRNGSHAVEVFTKPMSGGFSTYIFPGHSKLPVQPFWFRTRQLIQAHVQELLDIMKERAAKRSERVPAAHDYKVGDILYCS